MAAVTGRVDLQLLARDSLRAALRWGLVFTALLWLVPFALFLLPLALLLSLPVAVGIYGVHWVRARAAHRCVVAATLADATSRAQAGAVLPHLLQAVPLYARNADAAHAALHERLEPSIAEARFGDAPLSTRALTRHVAALRSANGSCLSRSAATSWSWAQGQA